MPAPAFLLFCALFNATQCYFALIVTPMLRLRGGKVKSWAGHLQTLQNCFYCSSDVNKLKCFNTF